MTGLVAGMGARAVLSGAGARLSKISPRTWLIIGGAVALLLGVLWHQHHARKALKAQYAAGYDQRGKDDAALAANLKRKLDTANARIADEERKLADEENRRIAATADAIRVSGPGKASCVRAGPSASSGGHVSAPAKADAAVDPVPDAERIDLIGLPFAGAVQGSEEHDELLNENTRWRDWYEKLKANWPKP